MDNPKEQLPKVLFEHKELLPYYRGDFNGFLAFSGPVDVYYPYNRTQSFRLNTVMYIAGDRLLTGIPPSEESQSVTGQNLSAYESQFFHQIYTTFDDYPQQKKEDFQWYFNEMIKTQSLDPAAVVILIGSHGIAENGKHVISNGRKRIRTDDFIRQLHELGKIPADRENFIVIASCNEDPQKNHAEIRYPHTRILQVVGKAGESGSVHFVIL